jgi:hypothetical protein
MHMNRRILIAAVALFLTGAGRADAATKFGIFYSLWHCPFSDHNPHPGSGNPPYNMTQAEAGQMAWGPLGSWHWKAQPELGYYCLATDSEVLRKHAEMIRDAGIDFVFLDSTNQPNTVAPDGGLTQQMITDPFNKMLEVWNTVPNAPKIVPWAPVNGHEYSMMDFFASRLAAYPNLRFLHEGKPLLLVTETPWFPVDQAQMNRLAVNHTLRKMWGQYDSGGVQSIWNFTQMCENTSVFKASQGTGPCRLYPFRQNGVPEQIGIEFAYQLPWMSDTSMAVPKFEGRTFVRMFDNVFQNRDIPIVLIAGWNEWLAIRMCADANGNGTWDTSQCVMRPGAGAIDEWPDGNKMFVDVYADPYSRDIEPSKGEGDFYYRMMKGCISAYRSGASSCPETPASAIAPAGGSTAASLTPIFSWTQAWNRNTYTIDLSEDPGFSWWWNNGSGIGGGTTNLSAPLSAITNTTFSGGRPGPAQLVPRRAY